MKELRVQVSEALSWIRKTTAIEPLAAIILGTGLDMLADRIDVVARVSCVPFFPVNSLHERAGEIVIGHLSGKPVLVLPGRHHYYEGYSMKEITFPVRVAKALGARALVIANAAGGLNPQFSAGDLMVITDHINLMGDNPLIGDNDDELGPRFPDMSEPYSRQLIQLAEEVALSKAIKLQRGVYLACAGPNLETRAEYRFMRAIGADAVGMSTVPEVIVAVHAGLKVLGFSAITDECFPDVLEAANVEKIIATAREVEPKLTEVVAGCIAGFQF